MISWQLMFELGIGALSTSLALGVEAWMRRNPRKFWLLLAPVAWLICLAIGSAVASLTIGEHPIIVTLTYLAIAAGGCRIVFLISPSRRSAVVLSTLICVAALLTLFELREPFVAYLDSFTFKFAGMELTLMKVLESLGTLCFLFWITHAFQHWLSSRIRSTKQISRSAQEWLIKLSELILYFTIIAFGMSFLGVDITTFAVFGGALGVGLGFGLQKIISNYVSGLILLFEKTVKIGDLIEFEGGLMGQVYRLDPRGTFILCLDGKEVIIPNDEFITKKVTNWTFSHKRGQVSIPVCISYKCDVEYACKLLMEAATEHKLCLVTPPPNCYLTKFGNHAIHVLLQFWIDDISGGPQECQSDVMFAILLKFKAAGIDIPVITFMLAEEE